MQRFFLNGRLLLKTQSILQKPARKVQTQNRFSNMQRMQTPLQRARLSQTQNKLPTKRFQKSNNRMPTLQAAIYIRHNRRT